MPMLDMDIAGADRSRITALRARGWSSRATAAHPIPVGGRATEISRFEEAAGLISEGPGREIPSEGVTADSGSTPIARQHVAGRCAIEHRC